MCRKSKNGAKRIAVLFCVFVLLALPCFARASWVGLFGVKEPTQQSVEVPQDSQKALLVESSQEGSMSQSKTVENSNYQALLTAANELEKESIELRNELTTIYSSYETLKTELENLRATDAISEAEYDTLVSTLEVVADKSADYEGLIVEQENTIAEQDVKIAKLKSKFFSPYVKLNVGVGFDTLVPNLNAGASLGAKLGKMMFEVGANYKVGDFKNLFNVGNAFSLDKLSLSASIGWMF